MRSTIDAQGFHLLTRPSEGAAAVHFAHATGFNATTYRDLFESFDPSIDLYAMDARGHGKTEAVAQPKKLRSWRMYEHDLAYFVAGHGQPMTLVGHSMGATVSLLVAANNPSCVKSLVLIEPVLVDPQKRWMVSFFQALGLGKRLPIAKAAARRTMEFESVDAAANNFTGKGPFSSWPKSFIQAYVEGGSVPIANTNAIRLSCDRRWESKTFAVATPNPFDSIRRVQCPITLVVGGKGTTCSNASRDAFMNLQPNTRLIERPNNSHFIPMEDPQLIVSEIERAI